MKNKDDLKEKIKDEVLEEIKEEVKIKTNNSNRSKNIIISILLVIIAILLFIIGYNWMNDNFLPMDKVDSGEVVDKNNEDNVPDKDADSNMDNDVNDNDEVSTDGITSSMKVEMKKIGLIREEINQISCGSHMVLMGSNQKLEEFTYAQKLGIVSSYAMFNNLVTKSGDYNTISSDSYYKIAKLYGFTESYETIFGEQEKDGNGNYFIPVTGCTSPSYLKHNVSFEKNENVITMTNNMTIVNTVDETSETRKVTYKFTFKEVNGTYEFVLNQVNYE